VLTVRPCPSEALGSVCCLQSLRNLGLAAVVSEMEEGSAVVRRVVARIAVSLRAVRSGELGHRRWVEARIDVSRMVVRIVVLKFRRWVEAGSVVAGVREERRVVVGRTGRLVVEAQSTAVGSVVGLL
jgi:hypothetical protein